MAGQNPNKYKATYGRKYVEDDVYTLALERVRRLYMLFDTLVVMFSGGKDSTTVLNVVTTVAKELGKGPVKVMFWDEEVLSYEVEEYIRRTAARPDIDLTWMCVPILNRNCCSKEHPHWFTWDPDCPELWVRPMPPEAVTHVPGYDHRVNPVSLPDLSTMMLSDPKLGRVCQVMGIRAQESLVRTRAVTRRQYDNYIVEVQAGASWGQVKERPPIPMFKAYPVYDWRVTDVWAAPAKYGWDYCEAYDLMEMAGIKAISQRLAPPFGEQSYRQLWMWKICFPEIWEKMCQRVPGAAAAALYSTTELYNSGRRVKPFDLTWEQYLEVVISKHLPEYQTVLIQRVRDELNRHFKRTTDPLAAYVAHPDTGLSWSFLIKVAEIADLKKRNDPVIEAGKLRWACKGDEALMWKKYRDDLENTIAGKDEIPEGIELPELEEGDATGTMDSEEG